MYTFDDLNEKTKLSKDFRRIEGEISRTYWYNSTFYVQIDSAIAIYTNQFTNNIVIFDAEGKMYSISSDYVACIIDRADLDFSNYVFTTADDKFAEEKMKELNVNQH